MIVFLSFCSKSIDDASCVKGSPHIQHWVLIWSLKGNDCDCPFIFCTVSDLCTEAPPPLQQPSHLIWLIASRPLRAAAGRPTVFWSEVITQRWSDRLVEPQWRQIVEPWTNQRGSESLNCARVAACARTGDALCSRGAHGYEWIAVALGRIHGKRRFLRLDYLV